MRTTVTLDPDVEQLLRNATQTNGQNFKDALNNGLRRSLAHLAPAAVRSGKRQSGDLRYVDTRLRACGFLLGSGEGFGPAGRDACALRDEQ
jgi:hypothetical protein